MTDHFEYEQPGAPPPGGHGVPHHGGGGERFSQNYHSYSHYYSGGGGDTDLYDQLDDQAKSLKDYVIVLFRYRVLIISALIVGLIIGQIHSTLYIPTFTSNATLELLSEDAGNSEQRMDSRAMSTYVKSKLPLLESFSIAKKVLGENRNILQFLKANAEEQADLDVEPLLDEDSKAETDDSKLQMVEDLGDQEIPTALLRKYLNSITFATVTDTTMINIYATTPNPLMSQQIATAHTEAYMELLLDEQRSSVIAEITYVQQKLDSVSGKVSTATQERIDYAKANNLGTDSGALNATFEARFRDLVNELNKASFEKVRLESRFKSARTSGNLLVDGGQQADVYNLKKMETDYNSVRSYLGSAHPASRFLKGKIDRSKASLRKFNREVVRKLKEQYEAASRRERSLRAQYNQLKNEELKKTGKKLEFDTLSRDLAVAEDKQSELSRQLDELQFKAENISGTAAVIEPALIPDHADGMNKTSDLLTGGLLGMILGIGLALLLDLLDNTIRTVTELINLTNVAVLGMIPTFSKDILSLSEMYKQKLISEGNTAVQDPGNVENERDVDRISAPVFLLSQHCAESESFRSVVATMSSSAMHEREPKVILVTSGQPGDGKTTCCVNIAAAMALTNGRTLLIDADLRLPRIHTYFGKPRNSVGLTEFLRADEEETLTLATHHTEVDGLDLLVAGNPCKNPARLLRSDRMQEMLEVLSIEYEYIVIDSPPVGPVADALLLSKFVDGVVLVARGGITPKPVIKSAVATLNQAQANILGTVLNDAKRNDNYREAGYYYTFDSYGSTGADGLSMAWDSETLTGEDGEEVDKVRMFGATRPKWSDRIKKPAILGATAMTAMLVLGMGFFSGVSDRTEATEGDSWVSFLEEVEGSESSIGKGTGSVSLLDKQGNPIVSEAEQVDPAAASPESSTLQPTNLTAPFVPQLPTAPAQLQPSAAAVSKPAGVRAPVVPDFMPPRPPMHEADGDEDGEEVPLFVIRD